MRQTPIQFVPSHPVWVKGTNFSRRVLRKHLQQHRQAILARAWVEVEDRAFRPDFKDPGLVYAIVPQAKRANHPDMQGTFLLLHLLTRVLFKFGCIIFLIIAFCVIDWAWRLRPLEKLLFWNSPLGTSVRVDWIRRNYELEISRPLFTVDRRIMNRSKVDVILEME